MNRKRLSIIIIAAVIALVIVGFIFTIFFPSGPREKEKVYVGFRGIAKANPFLAGERLFKRYDYKCSTVPRYDSSFLNLVNIIFVPVSALPREEAEIVVLEQWLDGGGILITGNVVDTPLEGESLPERLRSLLGLKSQTPYEDEEASDFSMTLGKAINGVMNVSHRVKASRHSEVFATDGANDLVFQYENVIYFNDISIFTNEYIRTSEHATLLYNLAYMNGTHHIAFVNSTVPLTVMQWLFKYAKVPIAIFLLCVLAYVLKYTKRFGPVAPETDQDRRQILEHISAAGQFMWKHKQGKTLFKKSTEELIDFIKTKHPYLRAMETQKFYEEVSVMSGISQQSITETFDARPANEEEFFQAINKLKAIRESL